MSKLTTRLTAILLSGMLVFGSAPGAVSAADAQEAPGQTSGYEEAAGDVLLEEPAEGNSGEEDPAAGSGGSADETAGELILDDTDNAAYEGDGSFEGDPGFYEDGSGSADEIAGTSDNTDDVTGPRPSEFSDITGQQPSAPFVQSYRIGGTVITLTAEVGVFPEGEIPVLESPQDDTLPQQAKRVRLARRPQWTRQRKKKQTGQIRHFQLTPQKKRLREHLRRSSSPEKKKVMPKNAGIACYTVTIGAVALGRSPMMAR